MFYLFVMLYQFSVILKSCIKKAIVEKKPDKVSLYFCKLRPKLMLCVEESHPCNTEHTLSTGLHGGGCIMMCGGFSPAGTKTLVAVDRRMDGAILDENSTEAAKDLRLGLSFKEDNCSIMYK